MKSHAQVVVIGGGVVGAIGSPYLQHVVNNFDLRLKIGVRRFAGSLCPSVVGDPGLFDKFGAVKIVVEDDRAIGL